jgi:hypothetical protein
MRFLAWTLLALAPVQLSCRQLLGLDSPTAAQDDAPRADAVVVVDAAQPIDAPGAPMDAPGYHATAVRFTTAGNDYLTTNMLANTSNSPRGTYSVWIRFTAGDGVSQLMSVAQVLAIGGVSRNATNHFQFQLDDCTGNELLAMETQNAYTTASGWVHLLAAWDVSAGLARLYVNGVADLAATPTIKSGSICYGSLKWGIGGISSGRLDADVADLYADLGTFVDISSPDKQLLFAGSGGKPIDLGPRCILPTGSIPNACFTGSAADWNVNKGSGQGFSIEGSSLETAPTSPSD